MTNKADLERVYFHNYQKNSRVNNPTYNSSCVNGSLIFFTYQKTEVESKVKKPTEYKTNFQPFNDRVNTLSVYQQSHNYGRYSKQVFDKNKSYLSQYGSNIITHQCKVPQAKK